MRDSELAYSFDAFEPAPEVEVPFEQAERMDLVGDDGVPRRMVLLATVAPEGQEAWLIAEERALRGAAIEDVPVMVYRPDGERDLVRVEDPGTLATIREGFGI